MAREAWALGAPAHTGGAGVALPLRRLDTRLGRGWEGPALLLLTVALLAIGLVSVYSATIVRAQAEGLPAHWFVVRQAAGGALGLVCLVLCAQLDYRRLRLLAWPGVLAVMAMLLMTVLPGTESIAPELNGSRRWLLVGPVVLHPGELAKLALILWTATLVVKKQDRLPSLTRGLMPFLVVWAGMAGLVMLQPNFSPAVLLLVLSGLVVFAGGGRIGHFVLLGLVALPLVWGQVVGAAYRLRRVAAFLTPDADIAGVGYQINQALIALGSGGLVGRGFGRGQQKFGFLPEPHNDFIFAMIGEEWGLLGTLLVLGLFTGFALVGYRVARHAPDLFGSLLALGLTNLIVVQALLHMAVNVALVPTTGVTLPFLSYGRSSLLVCLAASGILIGIARSGMSAAADARRLDVERGGAA
ncbi:MAG TPA: putative peptidoglycan glycosyltransferase FtsW [Longimicrobiales bacterium]|nr:putative peptidoglycan glycosyltransferase FtsW [Longimicrobiales bacterium]